MAIKACVLTGYGINADNELVSAFSLAGAEAEKVHINDLIENPSLFRRYQIAGFAGGFSFGDHLGSGLVYAELFKKHLKEELEQFVSDGKLIIGICNGFQVLVKMGVLPNLKGDWTQEVSLVHNNSGVFEDSWVNLKFNPQSPCIWTKGLSTMDVPIRHGEGRFITDSPEILNHLKEKNLIAIQYNGRNPNGSQEDIAGITDTTGHILGLMPHPEAFIFPENHPKWTRQSVTEGEGLKIFRNGVHFFS